MQEPLHRVVLSQLAGQKDQERHFAGVATLVIFPIIFAFLGAFTPDLHSAIGNYIYLLWIAVLVVFVLFAIRVNPTEQSALSLIVANQKLTEKCEEDANYIEQISKAVNLLTIQSSYSISMRAAVLQHSKRNITTIDELKEIVSELASPLYLLNEEIFDFGASEAWNFAVYLYSQEQDLLIPIWREKARNHPSKGLGRQWGRGEGHVGKAFVDQRAIITGNARNGEVQEFSAVPGPLTREYDTTHHVSFASVPIGPMLEQDHRPYGVIVGTSDRPDRFDREKTGILVHVAGAIAAVLIAGGLDIDKLQTTEHHAD